MKQWEEKNPKGLFKRSPNNTMNNLKCNNCTFQKEKEKKKKLELLQEK